MIDLFGKMREVQAKMKEAQENLGNIYTTAESGAGMVSVKVNGLKQIVDISVDQDLLKPEDKEMLQDLIIAAVNKAMSEAEVLAKEEIRKSTGGLLPNIPGLDLGNLV